MRKKDGMRKTVSDRPGKTAGKMTRLMVFLLAAVLVTGFGINALAAVDKNASVTWALNDPEDPDISKANVVMDYYRVADANVKDSYTYTYEATDPFADLSEVIGQKEISNEEWKTAAQQAAKIALGVAEDTDAEPLKPEQQGQNAWGTKTFTPGIYLVLLRGSDVSDYVSTIQNTEGADELVTIANSPEYTYYFEPMLIFIPGKNDDGTEYVYDLKQTLKYTREHREAVLEIVKSLSEYETKDLATFVFDVQATVGDDETVVYSNVIGITFDAPGQKSESIKLPAGAKVTVTEVYSGANYVLNTEDTPETQTVTIPSDGVIQTVFDNTYDDTFHGGGSIVNRFSHDEAAGWTLDPVLSN